MPFFQPVIHVESDAQARTQTEVARNAGADGVWLINHSLPYGLLAENILPAVRNDHPDFWIGVNFLDLASPEAMAWVCKHGNLANGLWTDRSGVTDLGVDDHAKVTWQTKQDSKWPGLYFGGVAFKYQALVVDWEKATKNAAPYMDVVTTSGPGTGEAASIDKIRWMSLEAPKLAIASGITPENVHEYLPHVHYFLVATGISKSFTKLDPERTKLLADKIHAAT